MKTYKVKLSFLSEEMYVSAENEEDAENKAVQEYESRKYHKADEVEVFNTPEIKVKYVGSDSFYRPIFKDIERKAFYGSTGKLMSNSEFNREGKDSISEKDLTYFGTHFDCEPMGTTPVGTLKIIWGSNCESHN